MPRTSPEPVGGFHHPVHITFADSNDAYSDHREILIKLSDNITSFTIFIKWCVIVERFSAPPRHRLLTCSNFVNSDLMIHIILTLQLFFMKTSLSLVVTL